MTSFLLDTNVISEPSKVAPNPALLQWIELADEQSLFLSVITFGEIRRGVALLATSKKRERYARFIDGLAKRFEQRILPIDRRVAEEWGSLIARCSLSGTPMPTIDAMLAATAIIYELTLVTRNVDDFRHAGVPVVNPFL